jgi:hypothetical protein
MKRGARLLNPKNRIGENLCPRIGGGDQIPFALPLFRELEKSLHRLNTQINKTKGIKRRMMDKLEITSHQMRKARTRSLVQLGALLETAGILKTFGITLGSDLQKDPLMKNPVGALFKGLLELNTLANSEDVYMVVWSQQGLEELRKTKQMRLRS